MLKRIRISILTKTSIRSRILRKKLRKIVAIRKLDEKPTEIWLDMFARLNVFTAICHNFHPMCFWMMIWNVKYKTPNRFIDAAVTATMNGIANRASMNIRDVSINADI